MVADPRYAGLAFFDPLAPRPAVANADPATFVDEPAALAPVQVWARDGERCEACGVTVDMRLKLPHAWWCAWWESAEGQAHETPF